MEHKHAGFTRPEENLAGEWLRLGAISGQIAATYHASLQDCAAAALPSGAGRLIGSFPFNRHEAGYLHTITEAPPPESLTGEAAPVQGQSLKELPPAADYGAAVARAVARLSDPADPLQKVVLARALEFETDQPINPHVVARNLSRDTHIHAYAMPVPCLQGTGWLVGATPELLLRKSGAQVSSLPLAGSAKRCADGLRDKEIGQALLKSSKDLAEHKHVVDYIHDVLSPYCAELDVPQAPSLQLTDSMWHLGTEIRGTLRDPDTPCLEILEKLHPTPAVGGAPLAPALELIDALEPAARGFYSGTLGWVDGQNDGAWYVTLRCAILEGRKARLYAGAGIVAQSLPEDEIAETGAKFIAMRAALGIESQL